MSVGGPLGPAPVEAPQTSRAHFYGSGGTLFGIHVVNIFLTLVTLGIYYFWGKVRVRKHLLSQTEFQGDRFAFHGTGKELLIGWLKAALVFGVPVFILGTVPGLLETPAAIQIVAAILLYALVLMFIPVAMVGARRYRLSRTSWRGIRFSFRGRAVDFIKLFVGGAFLTALTLGLYYPVFEVRRYAFLTSHACFGNQRFHFDGRGRDLFGSFFLFLLMLLAAGALSFLVAVLLGVLFAFGIAGAVMRAAGAILFFVSVAFCWFWYAARKQRYLWDHTSFVEARFHSTVTGWPLLVQKFGNLLLLLLTLGLAWPWVTARNATFAFRYLTLEGPLDLAAIQQEAQVATATGEGLAGFLDVGFDLG